MRPHDVLTELPGDTDMDREHDVAKDPDAMLAVVVGDGVGGGVIVCVTVADCPPQLGVAV